MHDLYDSLLFQFQTAGQGHVFAFWDALDDAQRAQLLRDAAQVDLKRCAPLIPTLVQRRPEPHMPAHIEPARLYPAEPGPDQRDLFERAQAEGEAALRAGRVAAFTVAGGQGTRLGFDGPKGAFAISPVRNACLFQLFAEYLLGVERRYGRRPRWYIMTSPGNYDDTLALFQRNHWFSLSESDVMFFPQREMPAFLPDGRIAMSERHRIALSPDGHGGSLWALWASGALDDMRGRGVEQISYFQVDNPLVRCVDPLFIGLHRLTGSEMSSKAVTKASDSERVGNFCIADGRLCIIEYSDLPEALARARNADGSRRFDAGSIAIHVLDRAFVERLADPKAAVHLPWHRADKKMDVIDERGQVVRPTAPNVVKLELFVFDAIPLARNPLALYTRRDEEFSPVKNAEGEDSPATARRDLVRRAARWLEGAGWTVPRDAAGEPALPLEISPAFALDAADLRERLIGRRETLAAEVPQLLA